MLDLSLIKKVNAFYFIGIGGVNMSALALRLKNQGFKVAGTDISENSFTKILQSNGIPVNPMHAKENLKGFDAVVYTSAINKNCAELKEAMRKKLLIISRSELLSYLLSEYKTVIAVSGSHGKTTTTAMITEIFSSTMPVTAYIGGESVKFSNCVFSNSEVAIVEACEYKRNFLSLSPTDAIILNIDKEHVDCYLDVNDAVNAYKEFSKNAFTFKNGDDTNCKDIDAKIRFGKNKNCNIYADKIKQKNGRIKFLLYLHGKRLTKITLGIEGKHNAINSLPAIAVALKYGIPLKNIKKALKNFKGVKRRNEFLGQLSHTRYYADYAHHPNEIKAFLSSKKFNAKNTLIVFQPHTYSRTKAMLTDFTTVLSNYPSVAIYKTYPAREPFDIQGDGFTLYQKLKNQVKKLFYYDDVNNLLTCSKKYKTVFILGAGDLYDKVLDGLNFKRR